jgi:hypothetical protein
MEIVRVTVASGQLAGIAAEVLAASVGTTGAAALAAMVGRI